MVDAYRKWFALRGFM